MIDDEAHCNLTEAAPDQLVEDQEYDFEESVLFDDEPDEKQDGTMTEIM